jgi:hypothetical protein
MLRFSVVHAPNGPTQGPGLDFTEQTPLIEESHSYYGPQKYNVEFPYGGGPDNIDGTNAKIPKKRIKERDRVRKPRSKKPGITNIAIDFDGTITADPAHFKRLIDKASGLGHKCHLVTGRPDGEAEYVKRFCSMHGIKFSSMNFYPIPYKFNWVAWDTLMDVRIGSWKATKIEALGATVVFDDNPIHIKQIVKRVPNIYALTPVGGK